MQIAKFRQTGDLCQRISRNPEYGKKAEGWKKNEEKNRGAERKTGGPKEKRQKLFLRKRGRSACRIKEESLTMWCWKRCRSKTNAPDSVGTALSYARFLRLYAPVSAFDVQAGVSSRYPVFLPVSSITPISPKLRRSERSKLRNSPPSKARTSIFSSITAADTVWKTRKVNSGL